MDFQVGKALENEGKLPAGGGEKILIGKIRSVASHLENHLIPKSMDNAASDFDT
jgi:hypothetical protein